MKVDIKSQSGSSAGSVELDETYFGVEPNMSLMHQVVNAQLAAKRQGTHKAKTRAEVSGGGAKPWRQKGTGRARAGSSRSPIWVGGGAAHGPKPRDYSERTNKKMIKAALKSALSDRAKDDKIVVVDAWNFEEPSTKDAISALESLGVEGRALVVLDRDETNAALSMRNLPKVQVLAKDQLNTHDVLLSDYVVFTQNSLPSADTTPGAPPAANKTEEAE